MLVAISTQTDSLDLEDNEVSLRVKEEVVQPSASSIFYEVETFVLAEDASLDL